MKTLKSISSFILLITGIITAITGAIQSILNFYERLRPKEIAEKSTEIVPDHISNIRVGGTELILIGCLLILFAVILKIKRLKELKHVK